MDRVASALGLIVVSIKVSEVSVSLELRSTGSTVANVNPLTVPSFLLLTISDFPRNLILLPSNPLFISSRLFMSNIFSTALSLAFMSGFFHMLGHVANFLLFARMYM